MRNLAPPKSISAEAQRALETVEMPPPAYPPLEDLAAWRALVAAQDEAIRPLMSLWAEDGARSARETMGGVSVVRATPVARRFPAGKVYLDIHGGALIYLGGEAVDPWARALATRLGAEVVSIDYRMAPDFPYPASLDDCLAVYRALLAEVGAQNLVVGGVSAGGNLAPALVLRARDEGLELPAGLVLLSPEADLTESGDTFQTLAGLDRLYPLLPVNRLYAGATPLDHPYVSPLFGDFTKGFPPTFLQSGTRDLFLSTTVRMHRALRRANIEAELHVWEAMPHGGFIGAPEDAEVDEELRRFLARRWT